MLENLIEQSRIFIPKDPEKLNDADAELLYRLVQDTIIIDSIRVDEALRGQGIAGKLVEVMIAKAQKENLLIYPICTFAVGYLEAKPEISSLITHILPE